MLYQKAFIHIQKVYYKTSLEKHKGRKREMPQNQQEKDVQAKRTRENVLGVVINVVLIIAIIIAFLCTYTAYVTKNGSGVPDILG